MREISRQDLKGLEGLDELRLIDNELQSLPSDLFLDMKRSTVITFEEKGSKIVGLPIDFSLDSIPQLKVKQKTPELPGVVRKDENFSEECSSIFASLWMSKNHTDFVVIVENLKIEVHKVVLSAKSPVLAAMLRTDMEERKSSQMVIVDFSRIAVEEFMRYLYTGEIQDEENAIELYELAVKYNVHGLESFCREIILCNIRATNAVKLLKFAKLYELKDLAEGAFEVIKKVYNNVIFAESLIDEPEDVEMIIKAKNDRDSKIILADLEFKSLLNRMNQKQII